VWKKQILLDRKTEYRSGRWQRVTPLLLPYKGGNLTLLIELITGVWVIMMQEQKFGVRKRQLPLFYRHSVAIGLTEAMLPVMSILEHESKQ
jgi:hypothetical protein